METTASYILGKMHGDLGLYFHRVPKISGMDNQELISLKQDEKSVPH